MSELKTRFIDDTYVEYFNTGKHELAQIYLKSEADKVIADLEESHNKEVGQLLIEIVKLKSEIERLEILCADYIHDCDNLAISNEQAKRAARTLLKKMNHHKHKRCLAMAKWCSDVRELMHKLPVTDVDADRIRMKQCKWCRKWRERWLAIAEKFKPNSTAQQGKEEVK